ncbi:cupin domain-containing protein [Anatilimnocola sp. NA78]|uniref:cupin domain-containing protein n=1 Tax=Anatilimnocola sp. NA78 TaxID=3415683 RepID=UPI003CE4B463
MTTPLNNLFAAIPADLPQELTQVLLAGTSLRIERIVSRGQSSPPGFWYDQPEAEWVLLVQGAARLRVLDAAGTEREVSLAPGDFLHLPAHQQHRVEWTDPTETTIWLAIFTSDKMETPRPA